MTAPAMAASQPYEDSPRRLTAKLHPTDRVFHGVARSIGGLVLVLTGAIGLFLAAQMVPVVRHYGFSFFTQQNWNPETNTVGVAAAVVGTIEVALIALAVGFPLALATALFITEYAPPRLRSTLVALVDLMAAVPSIVFGLWGFYLLQPQARNVARWLAEYFSFIPIFRVNTDAHAAAWEASSFTESALVAGLRSP